MTEERAIEVLGIMKSQMKEFGMTARFEGLREMQETAVDVAVKSLSEIQQYRVIGTVEECREARERQRSKEPIILSEQSAESEGKLYIAKCFKCPTCGNTSTYFGGLPNNCHNCGQSLESDAP